LSGELARASAEALAARAGRLVEAHFEALDLGFLLDVARRLSSAAPAKVALLTARGPAGACFAIAAGPAAGLALGRVGPEIAALFEGRGGGAGALYQGKAGSLEARPEALSRLARELDEAASRPPTPT